MKGEHGVEGFRSKNRRAQNIEKADLLKENQKMTDNYEKLGNEFNKPLLFQNTIICYKSLLNFDLKKIFWRLLGDFKKFVGGQKISKRH